MLLKLIPAILALIAIGVMARSVESGTQHVILLHGWNGAASGWDVEPYEDAGYTVHALQLPKAGTRSGDTWVNADYVEAYIAANGLTDVQVDGHSLGGTLVYELIRVRRNPAITSAVTRDSNIHAPANTGFYCWEGIGVPDQCSGPVRNTILGAPLADVPVLNLSTSSANLADVDCSQVFAIAHNDFLTNAQVSAKAVAWAGSQTCSAPTPTPTPAPSCPWWAWWC